VWIRVLGPGLVVEISRDAATQVDAALATGDPVQVEGTVLDDRQLRGLTVALRCEETAAATPAATLQPGPEAAGPQATSGADDDREDCHRGSRGRGALRFQVDDGEVRIKRGAIVASEGNSFTVDTPAGQILVVISDDSEGAGNLTSGAEVRLDGELQADGSVVAEKVKLLCDTGNDDRRNNEGDDDDEDEGRDAGDNYQEGDGRGEGRQRGRGSDDDRGEGD
jgi:hypothetical protein